MLTPNYKSPGVYINEVNALPNGVVPVKTAVPAFIGYTPQAMFEGKSYLNVPMKISSFVEFESIYCYPNPQLIMQNSIHLITIWLRKRINLKREIMY